MQASPTKGNLPVISDESLPVTEHNAAYYLMLGIKRCVRLAVKTVLHFFSVAAKAYLGISTLKVNAGATGFFVNLAITGCESTALFFLMHGYYSSDEAFIISSCLMLWSMIAFTFTNTPSDPETKLITIMSLPLSILRLLFRTGKSVYAGLIEAGKRESIGEGEHDAS
jgi:hypothetical protein